MNREFKTPDFDPPQIDIAPDDVLMSLHHRHWLYDIEVYENYVLVAAMEYDTGWCVTFELTLTSQPNYRKLQWFVHNNTLVGYNSNHYDKYILWAIMQGRYCEEIKAISDTIILSGKQPYMVAKQYGLKERKFDHIDLQQVAPAAAQQLSLKHYGGRMHVQRLQELPYAPNKKLTAQQQYVIKAYCVNDLIQTAWLYSKLAKPLQLRREMSNTYNADLRSSSDAQIAEKALGVELTKVLGREPKPLSLPQGEFFRYVDPGYLNFQLPVLKRLRDSVFETNFTVDENGHIRIGYELQKATNLWKVTIGETQYKLGIGGLHSSENNRSIYSTLTHQIYDRDVASYYPAIILNQGLCPQHLGTAFLDVYRKVYETRLHAKASGNKMVADSLKICINGCFGKLGSRWSIFYSPHLLMQVTLTGQLSLLLLIERLENAGIPVLSANTDGIVVRPHRNATETYLAIVRQWEIDTGFDTEETPYTSLHSRDVNNYIAVCTDGKVKAKGAYVNEYSMSNPDRESLMTNPTASICSEAVMRYLQTRLNEEPQEIKDTVRKCKDIRQFLMVRRVNGGAIQNQTFLGKVVRWYIGPNPDAIYYLKPNARGTTNRVPDSDGAIPLMDLPKNNKKPANVNHEWYIKRAKSILKDIGYTKTDGEQLKLF